jgi:hypothetical protein
MRPADFDQLPKATQDKIDDRIKQRKEEFADYKKDMQKLQDAGLIRVEPDGTVINTGLIPGGEKPFTGDHDIFDIRAKDGSKLTADQYQKAKAALLAADAGVMHGGVTGWEVDSPSTFNTDAGQKSYNKMVDAHTPGGKEPLVRLGDGEPKAVWYEPAPPAPAGPTENVPGGRSAPGGGEAKGRSGAQGEGPVADNLAAARKIAASDPDAFTVNEAGQEVHAHDVEPQPGAGAGAVEPAGPRTELPAEAKPDVRQRFADADAAFQEKVDRARAEGKPLPEGPRPSERFDAAMAKLQAARMGEGAQSRIEGMLAPGKGETELSKRRLGRDIDTVERTAQLIDSRPGVLTEQGQARMLENVRDFRREIEAAVARGESLNGFPLKESPQIRDALERMDAAFRRFESGATGDPMADLMRLVDLQATVGREMNAIRNQAKVFELTVQHGPAEPSAAFPGAREAPITVEARGPVTESLDRGLPGGSKESQVLTPKEIRALKTNPPELAGQLADELERHHRAHLIGPGFGSELRQGIMLAPERVNLDLQNKGVETFIRSFPDEGRSVNVIATAEGRRVQIPLDGGGMERVDILTKVHYAIEVPGEGTFEVEITITNGEGKVTKNTVPEGRPGYDEIMKGVASP